MALTNPATGQPLNQKPGVNYDVKAPSIGGYENPFGGTVPTAANKKIVDEDYGARPYPSVNQYGPSSSEKMVGSSDSARSDIAESASDLAKLKSSLDSMSGLYSTDITKRLADIDAMVKGAGTLTDAEQARIEANAQAAGREYDPLIAEAKESKRQGQAKALVGAGEVGGLMNTQFAGVAAVAPTEGGTFVGEGGKLAEIKGQLEANIQKVQIAKEQAISAARAAATQAALTNRKEDVKLAMSAFEQVKSAYQTEADLISKRVDVLGKLDDYNTKQKSNLLDQASKIAAVGGTIPEQMKTAIDAIYGAGFSDKYAKLQLEAQTADTEEQKLKQAQDTIDIISKLPMGKKLTIGDKTYEGIKENDNTQTFAEEDAQGNVTYVTIDKLTGQPIAFASGGKIGKGRAGSGGGSETPEGPTFQTPSVTFDEWLKTKQTTDKKTYNTGDPKVKANLQAQYDKEVGASAPAAGSAYTLRQLQAAITATDKAEMIKQNLNFNNKVDLEKYIKNKKTSSSSLTDSFSKSIKEASKNL